MRISINCPKACPGSSRNRRRRGARSNRIGQLETVEQRFSVGVQRKSFNQKFLVARRKPVRDTNRSIVRARGVDRYRDSVTCTNRVRSPTHLPHECDRKRFDSLGASFTAFTGRYVDVGMRILPGELLDRACDNLLLCWIEPQKLLVMCERCGLQHRERQESQGTERPNHGYRDRVLRVEGSNLSVHCAPDVKRL